jgi:proteic killer suppression protein
VIASFGDRATEDLFHGRSTRRAQRFPADIVPSVVRKLDMINAVDDVSELRSPPGNRLKRLKGELRGFHSLRINAQWRIIFRWESGQAYEVEVTDYHR